MIAWKLATRPASDPSVSNVVVSDTPDALTTLLNGTVETTAGTVTSGNGAGDTSVGVRIGTLAGRTTQVWDAVVTNADNGKTIALFRCTQSVLWPH